MRVCLWVYLAPGDIFTRKHQHRGFGSSNWMDGSTTHWDDSREAGGATAGSDHAFVRLLCSTLVLSRIFLQEAEVKVHLPQNFALQPSQSLLCVSPLAPFSIPSAALFAHRNFSSFFFFLSFYVTIGSRGKKRLFVGYFGSNVFI